MSLGNLGDSKFFGGIGEVRIDYGPGYRIYFLKRGNALIVLLCGGDKSTQVSDIASAKVIAGGWKE
ncbi:type II toxin-antitoxin system RelE/ParE family toxin [Mesorhizobium sp. ASY16-5R]|uniref:type II toxin-antitoxin system RelE/ParE family toxin n=1 Tax=Mesorhizobium sp. ASY16-5R TaxID=3445772 RepID=UPI003FA08C1D